MNGTSKTKAWQLFYMTAATMPPSKDFTSLVSGEAPGPGAAFAIESLALPLPLPLRPLPLLWQPVIHLPQLG